MWSTIPLPWRSLPHSVLVPSLSITCLLVSGGAEVAGGISGGGFYRATEMGIHSAWAWRHVCTRLAVTSVSPPSLMSSTCLMQRWGVRGLSWAQPLKSASSGGERSVCVSNHLLSQLAQKWKWTEVFQIWNPWEILEMLENFRDQILKFHLWFHITHVTDKDKSSWLNNYFLFSRWRKTLQALLYAGSKGMQARHMGNYSRMGCQVINTSALFLFFLTWSDKQFLSFFFNLKFVALSKI